MSNQPTSNTPQSNPSSRPPPGSPGNKGDQDDRREGQRPSQPTHSAEKAVESKGDPSSVIDKRDR